MVTGAWKNRLMGASLLVAVAMVAGCQSKEAKSERFSDSGNAYLAEGDRDSALIQFNNALFHNPENLDALRGAARIAGETENYVRQGRMLLRLLAVAPDDLEANNEFARLSLLGNDIPRAQEHANRVLNVDPNNVSALTTLGASYVMENRPDDAREILNRALTIDADNAELVNLVAAQSIRDGDIEQAIRILDDGVGKVDNPETLLVVRLVLADQHLTEGEVLRTFDQLIKLAPTKGIYRQKLAEYVLLKQGDMTQARQLFADSVPYLDDPTPALTKIVAIDRERGGDVVAEATLKSFLAANPQNLELRFSLPIFYCQTQQFDKCGAAYAELQKDNSLDQEHKLRVMNGMADVAIVQQRFEDAEKLSAEILSIDAKDTAGLITRAQVQLNTEQTQAAIESLRTALEGEPDNAEGLVYLALAYEQADQKNFADAQFARAIDQVGYLRPVVDQYRAFLIRNNEAERSMEVLERYLRANPGDSSALLQRAQGALAQGEFLQAENSARQLIADSAVGAQAGSILAQSLFSQERFVDALPVTEEILAANPDDQGNKILRASILQRLGRADEAIGELQAKISGGTGLAVDYALLGDLLNGKRDHAAARRVSVEGLGRYPDAEQLYILAYIAESRMGNTPGGTAVLRDGVGKAETTAQLRTLLSNELINARRFDEAVEILRSLERDNALSPLTANNLASLLLETPGNEEEALRIARLLEGADNPYFADTLGWAYFNAGQPQTAISYARRAAEGLPENADVQYHRGVIEAANGNPEQARAALEAAKASHSEASQTPMSAIDQALSAL